MNRDFDLERHEDEYRDAKRHLRGRHFLPHHAEELKRIIDALTVIYPEQDTQR